MISDGNLIQAETIITDTLLLPAHHYTYNTQLLKNGKPVADSQPLPITTMDTTSHDFTWEIFTFGGEAGNCVLYNCAIVNDTLAYAVGEIYLNDSTGQPDPLPYNFAKWNGQEWSLRKIAVEYRGNQTIAPLRGIFVLKDGKIILSSGLPYLPNGNGEWNLFHLWDLGVLSQNDGSVYHIWGSSIDNLFFVGNNGSIVHYSNGIWQKLESGTELPFQVIWGAYTKDGEEQILAVASNKFTTGGKYLVRITGDNAVHLNDIITTAVSLSGIWFIPDRKYYLVGDGIYSKHRLNDKRWQFDPIIYQIQYYPYSINGNGINDVALCGEAGTIAHFNGVSWYIYAGDNVYDRLLSIKMMNNLIIAAGTRYNSGINNNAVIYMGRR